MKDTLAKLRALVDIKTHLLKLLGEDLTTANLKNYNLEQRIEHLEAQNEVLRRQQGWWHEQDEALVEEARCTAAEIKDGVAIPVTTEDLVAKYEETERTVVIPVKLVINNDD